MPTAQEKAIKSKNGEKLLELKVSTGKKGRLYYFKKGEKKDFGGFYIGYNIKPTTDKPTFLITDTKDSKLQIHFPFFIKTLNMNDKKSSEIKAGTNEFHTRMLYQFGSNAVVLKDIHEKSIVKITTDDIKTKSSKSEYIK